MNSIVVGKLEVTGLAQREAETLAYTAQGFSGKETARLMGISLRTVEANLTHSRLRLGAKNTHHLIIEAIDRGIIRIRNTATIVRDSASMLMLCFALAIASACNLVDDNHDNIPRRTSRTIRIRRKDDSELTLFHDFD